MEEQVHGKDLFFSILKEHYCAPSVDVVQTKRARFRHLLQVLAKAFIQQRYEKLYNVAKHLRELLNCDEYPDEFVEAGSMDEIRIYLDIIYVWSCVQRGCDFENCMQMCRTYFKYVQTYPILYISLISCLMKLRRFAAAKKTITEGVEYFCTKYEKPVDCHPMTEDVRSATVNSRSYILLYFYAHGRILGLDFEVELQNAKQQTIAMFTYLKLSMDRKQLRCCVDRFLLENLKEFLDAPDFSLTQTENEQILHDHTFCCITNIFVNDFTTNYIQTYLDHKSVESALPLPVQFTAAKFPIRYKFSTLSKIKRYRQATRRNPEILFFNQIDPIVILRAADFKQFYKTRILPRLGMILSGIRNAVVKHMYEFWWMFTNGDCSYMTGLDDILVRLTHVFWQIAHRIQNSALKIEMFVMQIFRVVQNSLAELHPFIERLEHLSGEQTRFHAKVDNAIQRIDALKDMAIAPIFQYHVGKHLNEMMRVMRTATNTTRKAMLRDILHTVQDRTIQSTNSIYNDCSCRTCLLGSFEFAKEVLVAELHSTMIQNSTAIEYPYTANKSTQTRNLVMTCERATQKDDRSLIEIAKLKKHIAQLNARFKDKCTESAVLKAKLATEERKLSSQDYRIVKPLQRELEETKRAMKCITNENEHKTKQIEKLKSIPKTFSQVLQPVPVDVDKQKNLQTIANLQKSNRCLADENRSLSAQLKALTDEYDRMKAKQECTEIANQRLHEMVGSEVAEKQELRQRLKTVETDAKVTRNDLLKLQQLISNVKTIISDIFDEFIAKSKEYKTHFQTHHQELCCYAYQTSFVREIKSAMDNNQSFLSSMVHQLKQYIEMLEEYKICLNIKDICTVGWKTIVMNVDNIFKALLHQYVKTLHRYVALNEVLINHPETEIRHTSTTNDSVLKLFEKTPPDFALQTSNSDTGDSNEISPHRRTPGPSELVPRTNEQFDNVFQLIRRSYPHALIISLVNALAYIRQSHNPNLLDISQSSLVAMVGEYLDKNTTIKKSLGKYSEAQTFDDSLDDKCGVCFQKLYTKSTRVLQCLHIVHYECLCFWLQSHNVCPICNDAAYLQ